MRCTWLRISTLLTALVLAGCGSGSAVSFTQPADGETVSNPVQVVMEATGFDIEPAGAVRERAGHLHIMIDAGCITPGQPIPSDAAHLHYGMGQLTAEVMLLPGEHTLCLQAGDGAHTALDLTNEITITVQ